jgi:hypothetical protein
VQVVLQQGQTTLPLPDEQVTSTPPFPVQPDPETIVLWQRPTIRMPDPNEIEVYQAGRTKTFIDRGITVRADLDTLVRVPQSSVASHLKSLVVTVLDPTDERKSYAFLLRLATDGEYYEGIIPPAQVVGETWIYLDIYDYQASVVGRYQSQLTFTDGNERDGGVLARVLWWTGQNGVLVGVPFLLFWGVWLWLARRQVQDDFVRG